MVRMAGHAEGHGRQGGRRTILPVSTLDVRPFRASARGARFILQIPIVISPRAQANGSDLSHRAENSRAAACRPAPTCERLFLSRPRTSLCRPAAITAVEEAGPSSDNFAPKVTVITPRSFPCRKKHPAGIGLFKNPSGSPLENTTLEEVIGDENPLGVTAARA